MNGGAILQVRAARARFLALLVAFALSACTVSLLPAYDAALVERLREANAKAMVHFARLEDLVEQEGGASAEGYPAHADAYAELIGVFDELKLRAETRAMPPLSSRLEKSSVFRAVCPARDAAACLNASPASLTTVLQTLRAMRTEHRTHGLTKIALDGFRGQYLPAVNQVLTVEAALDR